MSPKDFLFRFLLTVAAILAIVYAFTYFEVKDNGVRPAPEHAVTLAPDGKTGGDNAVTRPGIGTELPAVPGIESKADENRYSLEKYPVSQDQGGSLKNIAADHSAIIIVDDNGVEHRAIITDVTEVFRAGERVELSAIKETDRITVLGRKRSADGDDFVADSIYAVGIDESPVPSNPLETPVEE